MIVPLGPGLFGFLGLGQLQTDMGLVRRFLENKALTLAGVFLVMTEKNNVCREFERRSARRSAAWSIGRRFPGRSSSRKPTPAMQSIFEHAPKSPGALAYKALTMEVVNRGDQRQEERTKPARRRSFRRTTRLEPSASGEEGRQDSAAEVKATKARKRKATAAAAADKVEDMKLYLTEDVRFRLRMQAFKRGKKISTVANEVLDKALPRWTLERTE